MRKLLQYRGISRQILLIKLIKIAPWIVLTVATGFCAFLVFANYFFYSGGGSGALFQLSEMYIRHESYLSGDNRICEFTRDDKLEISEFKMKYPDCRFGRLYYPPTKYCGWINHLFKLDANCMEVYLPVNPPDFVKNKMIEAFDSPCLVAKLLKNDHRLFSKLRCQNGKLFRQFSVHVVQTNLTGAELENSSYPKLVSEVNSIVLIHKTNQ